MRLIKPYKSEIKIIIAGSKPTTTKLIIKRRELSLIPHPEILKGKAEAIKDNETKPTH